MSDRDFIQYCISHSTTERSGFLPPQVVRILRMAGRGDDAEPWLKLPETRIISIDLTQYAREAQTLLDEAEKPKKVRKPKSEGGLQLGFYMQQEGEGCDYTVGCAQKLVKLMADNVEDAREEIIEVYRDYGGSKADGGWKRLQIVQILEDLDPDTLDPDEEEEEPVDPERLEYERLKRKFG